MNDVINMEDTLVNGLSFKLGQGSATYVERRRVVSFQSSASEYKPQSGSKLMKFNLSSSHSWLDVSTAKIQFEITNTTAIDTARLRFLSGPSCLFERAVLSAGSTVIEDISDFDRLSEMFKYLGDKNHLTNTLGQSHGHTFSELQFNELVPIAGTPVKGVSTSSGVVRKLNSDTYPGIKKDDSQVVSWSIPFGLFKQKKYIPLQYAPLTISLYLTSDIKSPIISALHPTDTADGDAAGDKYLKTTFTDANTSVDYKITNCEVKCDIIELDSVFESQFIKHLEANNALSIAYLSHVSQMQTITNQPLVNVIVSRAVSKLNKIFISFSKDGLENTRNPSMKTWKCFYSPMRNTGFKDKDTTTGAGLTPFYNNGLDNEYQHDPEREFKISMTLGGKQLIESPIQSHAECYSKLVNSLGSNINDNDYTSFNINPRQYRDSRLIMCFALTKVTDASFSGVDVRSGDQINVQVKFNNKDKTELPDRMHIIAVNEAILEIRSTGCEVIE